MMRGADLIADTLSKAGVKVIFSLSGNQIMPIYDACIDVGIRLIHTRHEAAAVYMAEAYAQLTGEVGVAMVTAGTGFANAMGPLVTAGAGESPILLLSGDSPRSQDEKGSFQELDQVAVSKPLTKLSIRPQRAENLGSDVAMALRVAASGRPGPVHIALPFDLLNEQVSNAYQATGEDFMPEIINPSDAALEAIIDAVRNAEQPIILTGPSQNPTRARGRLQKLADALDAPVIPMESPRGLKDPCLGDFARVLAKADVIVSIGKNIDFTTGFARPPTMAENCKFVVIDPETEILERARRALGSRLILGHRADAGASISTLIEMANIGNGRTVWRKEMADAIASKPVEPSKGKQPMHPATLCAAVQRLLDDADEPILIIDGGEFGQWAQACLSAKVRVVNGVSGAIGGGLCYAFAAKIARPEATVVALMGDGTAGFHFSEFETAHRYGTDFIAVIGHDSRWNAEYQIQQRDYGKDRIIETELNPTRYDMAAAGFGCHGEYVTDPVELDAALQRAINTRLPSCVVGMIEGLPAPSGAGH